MRCFPIILTAVLAGCGERSAEQTTTIAVTQVRQAAAADDGAVACAQAGQATLRRECLVERSTGAGGTVLTIRHPDGGFRRLLITRDGRGVIAADGAEAARVTVLDRNLIAVAIGGERYRLPATVR